LSLVNVFNGDPRWFEQFLIDTKEDGGIADIAHATHGGDEI
jgi:hypothetical protein